jgi:hypothetical protein
MGPPPAPENKASPGLIILLVVLVVAVVGGGAFLLLSGDDDDETATDSTAGDTISDEDASVTTLPGGAEDVDLDVPSDLPGDGSASHDGVTVEEIQANAGPPAPPPDGDPQFDQLEQDCYQGDMQACDDLYAQTPIGSAEEAYGDTCGARVEDAHGYYCTDLLPDPEPPAG